MNMSPQTERAFPWWDYLILPALSLLTAVTLLALAETTARMVWAKQTVDSCLFRDPSLGLRYKPSCTSQMKIPKVPGS